MVERKQIRDAGLILSAFVILLGIVDPRLAGTLADIIPATGVQLVIPLPNLGDIVPLLSEGGWVGTIAGFLVTAILTLAVLNLATRVAERFQSS